MLASWDAVLGFRLPSTGEYREFRCELPADLRAVLEGLGKGTGFGNIDTQD